MHTICAIVSGGAYSPMRGIEECDFVIACDKGYAYLQQDSRKPDLLVGDFDSYSGPLPPDVPRLDLPVEKDDSDTMAAIRYAVEQGYRELRLYCALGGRLDHLLANLQASSFAVEHGLRVQIVDAANTLYLFTKGRITVPEQKGYSLSVLALSDICTDVTIRGGKYPLEHATVHNTFPIGVSNEWRGAVEISVESGILAVILSKM